MRKLHISQLDNKDTLTSGQEMEKTHASNSNFIFAGHRANYIGMRCIKIKFLGINLKK